MTSISSATGRARHLEFHLAWLSGFILLVLLAMPVRAESGREIGAVARPDYRGAVARPDGRDDLHPIHYRDAVYSQDTVITGPSAATSLEFLDATRIDIGPDAEVRLDDFVYDPTSSIGSGEMSFAVGAFRYVGGKMSTEENVRLKTPTATMVIRGTELIIYVWPNGKTEVNVVSGAVEVMACGAGGPGQLAMSGMRVTVLPTCNVQLAAVRALPEDPSRLDLPQANENSGGDDGGDGEKDRRRDGRDAPSGSSKGSTGTGNNKGGAANGPHI